MSRFVFAALLAACTSPTPPTSEMTGHFAADLRGATLTLALQLTATSDLGTDDAYPLAPGEAVRATFRGHTVPLVAGPSGGQDGLYSATLTPDPVVGADEAIVMTFDRDGEAVTLTATTTPELALQAPASSPQPVTVSWSPTAADRMHWESSSPSVPAANGAIQTDTGQITFPPGVLTEQPPTNVVIDVARSRDTLPHTAFAASSAGFTRWRTVTVEVTP